MKAKRIVSLLLALALLGAFWVPAAAEATEARWFADEIEDAWTAGSAARLSASARSMRALLAAETSESGSCGEAALWTLDESGTLTISGSGAIKSAPDFGDKSRIFAVVIEDGITSIGTSAFYSCQRLRRVTIPRSVTQVGKNAFQNCFFLTDVDYAGTVAEWNAISFTGGSSPGNAGIHCEDGDLGADPLSAPAELSWGRNYNVDDAEYLPWDGMMSWATGPDPRSRHRYRVLVYNTETNEVIGAETWNSNGEANSYVSSIFFLSTVEQGGTYAFMVADLGDGSTCRTSEIVCSEPWTYQAPEEQLLPASGLHWERQEDGGLMARWENGNEVPPDGLLIEFFYTPDLSRAPQRVSRQWSLTKLVDQRLLSAANLNSIGEGYYSFRIKYLSREISQRRISPWTELSEGIYYGKLEEKLKAILEELGTGSDQKAREKALEAVRGLDAAYLAELMAADTDNSGVTAKLAELEYRCGKMTTVEVEEKLRTELEPSRVTAIGAGLNGEKITLRLTIPEERRVPSKSQVALMYFSVSLWEEKGEKPLFETGEKLLVPVKLTIPLPVGPEAEPMLLRQLPEGGLEKIPAHIFKLEDGARAALVLTEPGDYLLARPWYSGVELDLDGDGKLTVRDAAALFARVAAGTEAPDVDEDGKLTNRDAIALFRKAAGADE